MLCYCSAKVTDFKQSQQQQIDTLSQKLFGIEQTNAQLQQQLLAKLDENQVCIFFRCCFLKLVICGAGHLQTL
jgi:hypothetical protein